MGWVGHPTIGLMGHPTNLISYFSTIKVCYAYKVTLIMYYNGHKILTQIGGDIHFLAPLLLDNHPWLSSWPSLHSFSPSSLIMILTRSFYLKIHPNQPLMTSLLNNQEFMYPIHYFSCIFLWEKKVFWKLI